MALGLFVSLSTSPLMAFASETKSSIAVESMQEIQIQPRVNWIGSAYLSSGNWCNVTSSNNLFPDKPPFIAYIGKIIM